MNTHHSETGGKDRKVRTFRSRHRNHLSDSHSSKSIPDSSEYFDGFFCHSNVDKTRVENLIHELESRGYNNWWDTGRIIAGDSFIGEMNDGIERSRVFVYCFSKHSERTRYTDVEWHAAHARELHDPASIKIVPLRLDGGEPPTLLGSRVWIDLTNDWDHGVEQLCEALGEPIKMRKVMDHDVVIARRNEGRRVQSKKQSNLNPATTWWNRMFPSRKSR